MIIRLEFCEKTNDFHFNDKSKDNQNTNGYRTIEESIHVDFAIKFVEYVWGYFKDQNLTLEQVIKFYEPFSLIIHEESYSETFKQLMMTRQYLRFMSCKELK